MENQELSWTDINAIDIFRKSLKNQDTLRLKQLNKIDNKEDNYTSTNIISVGGPKRNNVTKLILNRLDSHRKYEIVKIDNEKFQIKRNSILVSDVKEKDYALFYYSKQNDSKWLVFAGLTAQSTIASIEAMLDKNIVSSISSKFNESVKFIEIFMSFDVFGEQRINPEIVEICNN